MKSNHQKEIEFLCNIVKPTHGVITNIGTAHLEGFKNLDGVIKTKTELFQFIAKNKGHLLIYFESIKKQNASEILNKNSFPIIIVKKSVISVGFKNSRRSYLNEKSRFALKRFFRLK